MRSTACAYKHGSNVIMLLLLAAVAAGCKDTSPGKDFQVTNAADNFQFQVTDMKSYTRLYVYTWANTGTSATVNQACSIQGGSATLSLNDASGALVYAKDLRENGTFPTLSGTAGNWRISVALTKVTGTLNFRVQKGP